MSKVSDLVPYNGADGYLMVYIGGKHEYLHRALFLEHHGYLPECVDHKDGNKHNNAIDNLRAADKSTNALNRGKQSNNTTGYKGVSPCKSTGKFSAFFRRRRLGRFPTAEEAYAAYCKASLAYNKEFHHG